MHQQINGPVYLVDDDEAIIDAISFLMEGYGYSLISFNNGDSFLAEVDLAQAGWALRAAATAVSTSSEVPLVTPASFSPVAGLLDAKSSRSGAHFPLM